MDNIILEKGCICNMDCFNCPHEDCIRDDRQDDRDRRMTYYYAHKELENQRRKERYKRNAEKEKAYALNIAGRNNRTQNTVRRTEKNAKNGLIKIRRKRRLVSVNTMRKTEKKY